MYILYICLMSIFYNVFVSLSLSPSLTSYVLSHLLSLPTTPPLTTYTATASMDLHLLNEALESAIQLGLRTPTIDAGVDFRDELAGKEQFVKQIVAACETLKMKAGGKGGITSSDVEALTTTLAGNTLSFSLLYTPLSLIITYVLRYILSV